MQIHIFMNIAKKNGSQVKPARNLYFKHFIHTLRLCAFAFHKCIKILLITCKDFQKIQYENSAKFNSNTEKPHQTLSYRSYANFHLAVSSIGNSLTIDCLSNHPNILWPVLSFSQTQCNLPLPYPKKGETTGMRIETVGRVPLRNHGARVIAENSDTD